MLETRRISRQIGQVLAALVAVFALTGLPHLVTITNDTLTLFAFVALLGLYILAVVSGARVRQSFWNGTMRLPVLVAWLSLGLESAALIVVIGSAVADALDTALSERRQGLSRSVIIETIASNGFGLLAAHTLLTVLGGSVPVSGTGNYVSSPLVLAMMAGSGVSLAVLALLSSNKSAVLSLFIRRNWLSETLILMVALVLPMILFEIGSLPFLIMLLLIASQIGRVASISAAQIQLDEHQRQISTLSSIGEAAASQISLASVLEMISKKLQSAINATEVLIALYDDHMQTFDYPLVQIDGKAAHREQHRLDSSLISQVVRKRSAIKVSRNDPYPPRELATAQFMAAPLIVGSKVIGVLAMQHSDDAAAFDDSDFDLLQTIAHQASLAMRNAKLYDRTVRLADNLSIINQSMQDVIFSLDSQEALDVACQLALTITQAQRAVIFIIPPGKNKLQLASAAGYDEEGIATLREVHIPLDKLAQGVRVINGLDDETDEDILALAKSGAFTACAQAPLRSSSNAVMGVLMVMHGEAHFYDQPECNLLGMLANQITAALDNADLLKTLEMYAAEQAQLVHLSRISSENLDVERVISDVCLLMSEIMQMPRVEIGLLQPERGTLLLRRPDDEGFSLVTRDVQVANVPELDRLLDPASIITLRTFQLTEGHELSEGLQQQLAHSGDQTLAVSPMRVDGRAIGVILMAHYEARNFGDNDYRLIEMATNQITTQVHNAIVHTRTEEALAQRLEQLALIEEIAQQIAKVRDGHAIIENVLEAALQATHADFASVLIDDQSKYDTYDIIAREVIGDQLVAVDLNSQPLRGIVQRVMQTAQTSIIPDNSADPDYTSPPASRNQFQSTLAVPLQLGGQVIGVLKLESAQRNFFTLEHASFIKSLAGHAAISIDSARMLTEREQQINTLTLLRELSLEALSVVDVEQILDAILRTALIILHGRETILYDYDRAQSKVKELSSVRFGEGAIEKHASGIASSLVLEAAQSGQIVTIEDIRQHSAYARYDVEALPYRSLLLIPIRRRKSVSNVLCVTFAETQQFNSDVLNTAELIRAQVAGHLENVMLNEKIRTSNNRMRAILDSTRDGIILLDRQGRIQDVNNAAIHLSRWPLLDGLGKPLIDLRDHESADSDFRQIADDYDIEPERLYEKEFNLIRDGEALHLKTFIYRVEDQHHDTAGWLLILRDITQQKELKLFRDKIQSMVLHDLRGPLSSIMTSMYVAMSIIEEPGDDPLEETLIPTLQVSLDSANDLLHMTDTLRDLPMIAKMQINPEITPLASLATKAYQSLSSNIRESNIGVEIDMADDETANIDPNLIRRVFVNLMHNAFKFTPEDGKILLKARPLPDMERVLIQVADTGPGIPDEQRERIFGEFVQIEGRRPRAGGKGMGLGLNFCKLAVEAHGGQIWVERDGPLSGACFSFTVPAAHTPLVDQTAFASSSAD